jgi:LAO/AO transport system kinase
MEKKNDYKSAIKIQESVEPPPNINPDVFSRPAGKRRKTYTVEEFTSGILSGNRTILSQAITMVESSHPKHYDTAQEIIARCLPYSARSVRIGITGVPGAGKSTFIETLGLHIAAEGRKLAVLTIDPSSKRTGGSILGDKTRMEKLSVHPDAFIRPSPSAGTLGGVARKTREIIILCEAAGFDTVIVETVGVGQSETVAHSMVDFFVLLMLGGAGDDLQGIKRGILEVADLIAVNKADGSNRQLAEGTKVLLENTLRLFPPKPSGWLPLVQTCSAITDTGIIELWKIILEYTELTGTSGFFDINRKQQAIIRMHDTIVEYLNNSFYNNEEIRLLMPELEKQLYNGSITSYTAASRLLDKYFKRCP